MGDGTNPRDTARNRKVNEVAEAMMEVWNRVAYEPVHATEVANFADMARMLVDRYDLAPVAEMDRAELAEWVRTRANR